MSSFLERQRASFTSSLASAASRISAGDTTKKTGLAPPSPSPSVASTSSAIAPGASGSTPTKKARYDANAPIYSQPEATGTGHMEGTQIYYAVKQLKDKDRPLTLTEVIDHMDPRPTTEAQKREVVIRLRKNPRIRFIPDPSLREQTWETGTYEHSPVIPGVRTNEALLKYLQNKKEFSGVSVKDLEDGWAKEGCHRGISELESVHKVIAVRTKKDSLPRHVWGDDPTLWNNVDPEFQNLWHKVALPDLDDMNRKLVAAGQRPSSDAPRKPTLTTKVEKKKKRATKKPQRITNDHMIGLFSDMAPTPKPKSK